MPVSMNVGPHLQRRGRRPGDWDRWDDGDDSGGGGGSGSGSGGDLGCRCVARGRRCTSPSRSSDNRFLSRVPSATTTSPRVEFVLRSGEETDENLTPNLSVIIANGKGRCLQSSKAGGLAKQRGESW